jgi:hypothetical protein
VQLARVYLNLMCNCSSLDFAEDIADTARVSQICAFSAILHPQPCCSPQAAVNVTSVQLTQVQGLRAMGHSKCPSPWVFFKHLLRIYASEGLQPLDLARWLPLTAIYSQHA